MNAADPHVPKTKWLGLKSSPSGPAFTESMVPGSKSTKTARGTYFPGAPSLPGTKGHTGHGGEWGHRARGTEGHTWHRVGREGVQI